jgi:hypothetical protein
VSLFLSFSLILLVAWRWHLSNRREADMELFQAYEDGALDDYAFAVTRGLPCIESSKGSDLADAEKSAKRSVQELNELLKTAPPGWIRSRLLFVLPLHERMAVMLTERPKNPLQRAAWLEEEKDIRSKIVYTLEDVRYDSFKIWKITKSRYLELNALIYSLKEAGGENSQ